MSGKGQFKSLYQKTREEKAKGHHHTQKKEYFAGPPTLAGASEVGEAFAESSVHDKKTEDKWVFRIPILADFGGQRVGDIFGDEVRGLHSTYNSKIKKQIEKSSKEKRKTDKTGKEYFIIHPEFDVPESICKGGDPRERQLNGKSCHDPDCPCCTFVSKILLFEDPCIKFNGINMYPDQITLDTPKKNGF